MKSLLEQLRARIIQEIESAKTQDELKNIEIKYLGRNGELTIMLKGLKDLSAEEKPVIGKFANEVKIDIDKTFKGRMELLEEENLAKACSNDDFDTTMPGTKFQIGHLHPLFQVQRDVERIFGQMGFAVIDGLEMDSEYYNFESLNIPETHPARDMQDTFFIKDKYHDFHKRMVMRTHTSPLQVRSMEKYGAPLRIIVPGRVFRYEATDASHDATFNQVEGMLIDKNISLAHLKGVMTEFLTRLFGKPVKVRFRPGYFPFVEPGIELDLSCLLCDAKGCRVCKHTGWMEFMGAGMTHPNVLRAGGIDPNIYQGWAFGFGLTRLTMMKYNIDDIRLLMSGNLKFLNQF
ncbi:MAG: phenylalanyl-tRNA synthetase subunit alpha, phenylalanyl-tRNA synthetase alpha chain [Candidatus Peregrinibacteria bacterium GW2011_GWF2_38_29]|nr:MAG: phenylalanyl-tRNA synthetase subunit alpha, phenylalanyl-tRNA synthetase alpha chain [Candidatus Peregrinibacteria bacterium GW2011_GWF2_38_29]HBB03159.1 phenylalanine--tRNA ligase subunit alpha [Candidatus Peregrinibacteria bacterium]